MNAEPLLQNLSMLIDRFHLAIAFRAERISKEAGEDGM